MLKFRSSEYKGWSELHTMIEETHNTTDQAKLKDPSRLYYNWKNKIYNWFNIFNDWNICDKNTFNMYLETHQRDIPSVNLWWTPNGNRLDYHKNNKLEKLNLKADANVTWFYRFCFDVDKKDVTMPLPDDFKKYWSWAKVPSKLFFEWYVAIQEHTEVFINWAHTKWITSRIILQFSWVVLTPWWFHAYIELTWNQQEKLKDVWPEKYKDIMVKFLAVVWDAMCMDTHIQNMNVALRLPWSIHRKNKETWDDYENSYITTPYKVSINYAEKINEDWAIIDNPSIVKRWEPFDLDASNISCCSDWFFNSLMVSINETYDSKEFQDINFYNISSKKAWYIKNFWWINKVKVSEMEIFRCMAMHWLTWTNIISQLPWKKIRFSLRSFNTLDIMNDNWSYTTTSWYKFYKLPIPEYTPKLKNLWGMFDIAINEDTIARTNYCWWYLNDFSNDRPKWPILNFLYMYFKWLDSTLTNGIIISKVWQYLKSLCPEIDETKLWNRTSIDQVKQVVGTPERHILVTEKDTRIMAERQTPTGKVVKATDWNQIFDKQVWPIKKVRVRRFGSIFTKDAMNQMSWYSFDDDWNEEKEEMDYLIKYCVSWKRKWKNKYALIKKYATVKEYNNDMVNADWYPLFIWDDLSLKLFYWCFDDATDDTLEHYDTYWIPEEYGHVWSWYYYHPITKEPFAVLWSEQLFGDKLSFLDWSDMSTNWLIDHTLKETNLQEYCNKVREIGKNHIRLKSFINAWWCASMNLKELMKQMWWSVSTNLSVYWPTQSWKSTLMQLIMSFVWYKYANTDSTIWSKKVNGIRVVTLNWTTPDPFKTACTDYSSLFVDEVTSKDNSNKIQFLKTQSILREAINWTITQRWSPWWNSFIRSMNTNIISFWETPYSDESVRNRFVRIRISQWTYYKNNKQAFEYCASHTCCKEIHYFRYSFISEHWIEELQNQLENSSKELLEQFKGYTQCTQRRSQIEAYWYLFWIANWICTKEEYFEWIAENFKSDWEYNKNTFSQNTWVLVRSINWILQYASSQNCSININVIHKLDDMVWDMFMIEILPQMWSKRLNQIDTQVMEMTAAFNWLFVQRDENECVKICAYDVVWIDTKLNLKDEYHKKVQEANWHIYNECKHLLDSSSNRFRRKTLLEVAPSFITEEVKDMFYNGINI